MEIWKDIENYEGLYQISNLGRVKSYVFWNGHKYLKKEKILKGWIRKPYKKYDYKCQIVGLSKNKIKEEFRVHRLVAKAFIPNPFNKPEINHIDFNPLNNRVENLEWCSRAENVSWSAKNRRMNKLDMNQEKQLIKMYKNKTPFREIEKRFNITNMVIYKTLKKYSVERDMQKKGKYNINLKELLEDFRKGKSHQSLVKKYNCSYDIITVRKYQFRKKGLL